MSTAVFGAPDFKARSGRKVTLLENGHLQFANTNGYLGDGAVMDAEEFFQAKRDAELGRWRWPENPDYVVYPHDDGFDSVRVLHEVSGFVTLISRDDSRSLAMGGGMYSDAARAYFEAHPGRKPWEDAQAGEVWVLRYCGEESAWVAGREDVVHLFVQAERSISKVHHLITEGRKIWPEDAS